MSKPDVPSQAGAPAHYPMGPVFLIILGWLFFFVIIGCYASIALLALPMVPLFLFGPVCLLVEAYDYAERSGRRS